MLQTFKGVVLSYIKYSENSFIVKIYTDKFGMQSFIIKGLGNKKNKAQKVCLQPLSLVELNANVKESKGIHHIKTIKLDVGYHSIPFDIIKTSIAFFLAEALEKLIKEEEPNHELFVFIKSSLEVFDLTTKHTHDFHLFFLLRLTKYFGIYPLHVDEPNVKYFDFSSGSFKILKPNHVHCSSKENSSIIKILLKSNFTEENMPKIRNQERKNILSDIIEYYSLHSLNLKTIKSKEILAEILA